MIFSALLKPLKAHYGIENMPFMQEMLAKAAHHPYRSLKILHNIPLCLNTLLKIEPLIVGGAEVLVTNPRFFSCDDEALKLLKKANISVERNHQKITGEFDYVLDAAGDFKERIVPRRGAAELTKSGESIYSDPKLTYPVINVDNSRIKALETYLGTGDGLVRGLRFFVGDAFHHHPFVLFGYGKVGKGVAKQLAKYTPHLTIIDASSFACEQAKKDGFSSIFAKDKEAVHKAVKDSYAIVTATGIKNVITNFYDPHMFKNKILVNIGVDDEYGSAFSKEEVLNDKQAVNFALPEPTALKYIDPIFYAHNLVIDLIENRYFKAGIHPFPKDIDELIMAKWQKIFHETL